MCLSHPTSRLAQACPYRNYGESKVKAKRNLQVLSQVSACIKFATVSLVKERAMAKPRVSIWGHFQRHDIWRLLIRAINRAIYDNMGIYSLIYSDSAKSLPVLGYWWHLDRLHPWAIWSPLYWTLLRLGFPRKLCFLPTLSSSYDSNWLSVIAAAPDGRSSHSIVRAQRKSPLSLHVTLASFSVCLREMNVQRSLRVKETLLVSVLLRNRTNRYILYLYLYISICYVIYNI